MKGHNLHRHLLFTLSLMALIPLIALTVSVWLQVTEVKDQSIQNVHKTVGMLADDLQKELFEKREGLEKAAVSYRSLQSLESPNTLPSDILAHLLYNAGRRFSQTIYVDDRDQLVDFASGLSPETAQNIRNELVDTWVYRHAQRHAESAISDAYQIQDKAYVIVAVPVLSTVSGRRHNGVIASRISVSDLLEDLAGPQLPPHTQLVLQDSNGKKITSFGVLHTSNPIVAAIPIRALDWEMVYYAPQTEILSQAHLTALIGLSIVILIAFGTYMAGLAHLKQLSDFFDELGRRIRSISGGDLSVHSKSAAVSGMPEAALILEEFQTMASNLKKSREEIRAINTGLEERIRERTAQLSEANAELSAITELLCPINNPPDNPDSIFAKAFYQFRTAKQLTKLELSANAHSEVNGYAVTLPNQRQLFATKSGGLSLEDQTAIDRFAGFLTVVLKNEDLFHETQAQHAALSALFSAMSEGFALLDENSRPVFVNQRFKQILMLSEEGRRMAESLFSPPAHAIEMPKLWLKLLNEPNVLHPWSVSTPGGKQYQFTIKAFPVHLAHQSGIGLFVRDVTHEFEINRLKDDVIALVSHELNNPISTITLGLETLRDKGDRLSIDLQRRILCNLIGETARLKELIHDWLDISMLNNGVMPCIKTPIDLGSLLSETVRKWEAQHDISVQLQISGSPIPCQGDPKRLVQVFTNLLDNALRYNNKQDKMIQVSISQPEPHTVTIYFEDNGIGISPGQREQIFDRFYRTNAAKRHVPNGSGLGLAICRGIAAAHDGSLVVAYSEPDIGSRFALTLPLN